MPAEIPPFTCRARVLGLDRDVTVNVCPERDAVMVRIDTAVYPIALRFNPDDLARIAERLQVGADQVRFPG
jgi:hypothetical protein